MTWARFSAALHDDVQPDVGVPLVHGHLDTLAQVPPEEPGELAHRGLLHADHAIGGAGRLARDLGDDLMGDGDGACRRRRREG